MPNEPIDRVDARIVKEALVQILSVVVKEELEGRDTSNLRELAKGLAIKLARSDYE